MVWPGMNQVALMSYSASSARIRRAPTRPNSPRDIGVGEVRPREIQPETASKSKVRQTMRLAMARASPQSCPDASAGDDRPPERRRRPISIVLQPGRGKIDAEQAPVPPDTLRLLRRAGVGIVVEQGADKDRPLARKGIALQQRRHRRLVLQQPLEESPEPRQAPRIV